MMKIRKLFLSILLSGMTLGSAAAQVKDAGPARRASAARSVSRHLGDAAAPEAQSGAQRPQRTVLDSTDLDTLAPGAASYDASSVSFNSVGRCDCSSGTGCSGTGCRERAACGSSGNLWFGAETLLWWGQKRDVPPLLTTSAAGIRPVAGNPGVTTVVGGPDNGLDAGLMPGYRLSGGLYFGSEKQVGLSGRVFGLFRSSDTLSASGNGLAGQSVGLPFLNAATGQPAAYLVAFNQGGQPVARGTASIHSKMDLIAAEPSLRLLISGSRDHQIDLLGGYTYLRLRDSLGISTRSTDLDIGNPIPNGTTFVTSDLFHAANTFHGGHIGLANTVSRSRVSLNTLTKVSFGNMRQVATIGGNTVATRPSAAPVTTAGGIYAQQSNIAGSPVARDTFAFIPELGVQGGLRIRENVALTAGYTFVYISKVALAGNQIDPRLDLSQAQGGPQAATPLFNYRDGSMWFQGLDLGLNLTF